MVSSSGKWVFKSSYFIYAIWRLDNSLKLPLTILSGQKKVSTYNTMKIWKASKDRSDISFSFTILPRNTLMKRKLYFHRLRVHGLNRSHTHILPEIQVYKELIIYKTKSFIMYTATLPTPGINQNTKLNCKHFSGLNKAIYSTLFSSLLN